MPLLMLLSYQQRPLPVHLGIFLLLYLPDLEHVLPHHVYECGALDELLLSSLDRRAEPGERVPCGVSFYRIGYHTGSADGIKLGRGCAPMGCAAAKTGARAPPHLHRTTPAVLTLAFSALSVHRSRLRKACKVKELHGTLSPRMKSACRVFSWGSFLESFRVASTTLCITRTTMSGPQTAKTTTIIIPLIQSNGTGPFLFTSLAPLKLG